MSAASVTVFPRRTPPNILVAEYDAPTRCLVSDELRAKDFKVLEASSLDETLVVLDAVRVDLLFLDLDLVPADGRWNVVGHLRERFLSMRMVFSSRAADEAGTLANLGPVIRKPYLVSQAVDLVTRSLSWPDPSEA